MTRSEGENSAITWRHAPHGRTRLPFGPSATTAMEANCRIPWATALAMAARSAQIVRPKDAFSTLQPVTMEPFLPSRAAPTLNLEYGA